MSFFIYMFHNWLVIRSKMVSEALCNPSDILCRRTATGNSARRSYYVWKTSLPYTRFDASVCRIMSWHTRPEKVWDIDLRPTRGVAFLECKWLKKARLMISRFRIVSPIACFVLGLLPRLNISFLAGQDLDVTWRGLWVCDVWLVEVEGSINIILNTDRGFSDKENVIPWGFLSLWPVALCFVL